MEDWGKIALTIAKEIEKVIMPLFGKDEAKTLVGRNPSGDETKLVDKKAEDIIMKHLSKLDINIVSEEFGILDRGSEYTAVVDPLDGSYNFVNGIPFFCFSIAIFVKEMPFYGMIYEFLRKNAYEGIIGKGAYLNRETIKIDKSRKSPTINFYTLGKGLKILNKVRRVRVLGAVALELAYLAKGATDGVVDVRNHIRPTDIAAGIIIAKEAGAIICDEKGKELKFKLNATDRINFIAVKDEKILDLIISNIK
jgi:myo-inositol-1(or 4)-monophosphatase